MCHLDTFSLFLTTQIHIFRVNIDIFSFRSLRDIQVVHKTAFLLLHIWNTMEIKEIVFETVVQYFSSQLIVC